MKQSLLPYIYDKQLLNFLTQFFENMDTQNKGVANSIWLISSFQTHFNARIEWNFLWP